jgi:hypothetical protein
MFGYRGNVVPPYPLEGTHGSPKPPPFKFGKETLPPPLIQGGGLGELRSLKGVWGNYVPSRGLGERSSP